LTEVAKAFEADTGHHVTAKFGPSGVLKDEIANGAKADVFASANMEHPAALSNVELFVRGQLCALARPGVAANSSDLLELLLDPAIKRQSIATRAAGVCWSIKMHLTEWFLDEHGNPTRILRAITQPRTPEREASEPRN
jgi:ABC-type molybdate transport system substrate-binding protein